MRCLAGSHIHTGVKNSISQLVQRAPREAAREKVPLKESCCLRGSVSGSSGVFFSLRRCVLLTR